MIGVAMKKKREEEEGRMGGEVMEEEGSCLRFYNNWSRTGCHGEGNVENVK
jgi:hypothetical protein